MPILPLADLKAALPRNGRIMGLDLGEKTIGLSVSDPGLSVASPIGTIRRTKFTPDAQELARAMKDRGVTALVVGLPMNMDGTEGPRAQSVRGFVHNLLQRPELFGGREPDIAFWDERLSTSAVDRMMIGWDMTRKRRDEVVDKMAAAYILQGALDHLRHATQAGGGDDRDRPDDEAGGTDGDGDGGGE